MTVHCSELTMTETDYCTCIRKVQVYVWLYAYIVVHYNYINVYLTILEPKTHLPK